MLKVQEIKVSDHANERFIERVLGIKNATVSDAQKSAVTGKILALLKERYESAFSMGNGDYKIDGFVYVISNYRLVTIKDVSKENIDHEVKGGRMRSGAKIKKRTTLNNDTRQNKRKDLYDK